MEVEVEVEVEPEERFIQLFVKSMSFNLLQPACTDTNMTVLSGRTITIICRPNETVVSLRNHILEKELFALDNQLSFNGKALNDARTLAHYGIISGSTIHIVSGLKGGGKRKQHPSCASDRLLPAQIIQRMF
jgi:hypothetical protein